MIDTSEFLFHARLDAEVLEAWVEAGWLLPRRDVETRRFTEVDLARAQLIRDLKDDMGVNDEGVAVILDLVDQVHGLRRTLRIVGSAVGAQPEALRRRRARIAPTSPRRRSRERSTCFRSRTPSRRAIHRSSIGR
jgi:chaperone modulatory protein CbpM